MRRVLLTLVLLAFGIAAPADQEGPYTFTVTNGTATITRFDDFYSGALSITNTLGGCPVTSTPATIYYRPGTTGWSTTHCDRPTAVWTDDATVPTGETVPAPSAVPQP